MKKLSKLWTLYLWTWSLLVVFNYIWYLVNICRIKWVNKQFSITSKLRNFVFWAFAIIICVCKTVSCGHTATQKFGVPPLRICSVSIFLFPSSCLQPSGLWIRAVFFVVLSVWKNFNSLTLFVHEYLMPSIRILLSSGK